MCSTDFSAIILDHSTISADGYTSVWVALPTATSAIVYLQDEYNMPETPLTCTWSTPLGSQSYVTYGCIDHACFSVYVVIGVYMNLPNNTIIYVPLCNVSVLDSYIGGFTWNVLGSSITNPQVIPYPPIIPTYTTTTTTTSTTGSNSSGNNSMLGGVLSVVGALVLIVAVLGGAICYR